MKKTLSLILALTLCMALAAPAFAEGEYGEVTVPYLDEQIVFDSAKTEKKTITVIERNLDYVFAEVTYENATLITVKPKSIAHCSYVPEGNGYYLDGTGNYHLAGDRLFQFYQLEVEPIDGWFVPRELSTISDAPERLDMIKLHYQSEPVFIVLEGKNPSASTPPAKTAEGFGEATFDYNTLYSPKARATFNAAKIEVTNIDGLGDSGFENGIYENAILVTVQSGSTFSTTDCSISGVNMPAPGGISGTGFAVGDDGKFYSVATVSIGTLEGAVDDLFGDAKGAHFFGADGPNASHFKNGANDHDICLVWLSECIAYDNNGNGHVIFIARNGKVETPAPAAKPVVVPTSQKLTVNGVAKNTEIYNIDGSNYFKLRDMAALLNGTGSQFSVKYDAARNTIVVKTGEAYTPVGGELATGTDKSASAVASAQSIEINGAKVELTAFNIGGNNFFKLRELGAALGFDVDYDNATATMIVKSK